MSVLKENVGDLSSLTAEIIQRGLESRLGVDLAAHKEEIEQVLKSVRDSEVESMMIVPTTEASALTPTPCVEPEKVLRVKKSTVRKNFPFSKSDDEGDTDFDPRGSQKKHSKNSNRKKLKE